MVDIRLVVAGEYTYYGERASVTTNLYVGYADYRVWVSVTTYSVEGSGMNRGG